MAEPITRGERGILSALADDGRTIVGGFDYLTLLDLEQRGLIMSGSDAMFPSFTAYRITDAGRNALSQAERLLAKTRSPA